jgi:pimeloyl-ACP methyl ester carboxylesterase
MSATFWTTLASIVVLPVLLLLVGLVYQRVSELLGRRRLLAPGRLVDIGDGRRLYILKKGQGGPSVVFESGFAATSLNWINIQSAVGDHVHTVSYDRCGLGWSSAATAERTPKQIATELRTMLRAASIEPPYVLVGHSFGGLVMRRYALEYPEEALGVVLVDPMRASEWPPVNETRCATVEKVRRLTRWAVYFAQFGLARLAVTSLLCGSGKISGCLVWLAGEPGRYLANRLTGEIDKMPREVRPSVAAHWSVPSFYHGLIAHLDALTASVDEMYDAEPIRGVPVDVLTPGRAIPLSPSDLRRSAWTVGRSSLTKAGTGCIWTNPGW